MRAPGWDNRVLEEMRTKHPRRLREFWDAGIRGPDFVWAATGPALEAYSRHPVVKKANEPGEDHGVSQSSSAPFGGSWSISSSAGSCSPSDEETVSGLDDVTTYYLLHRNDFGLDDAPVGACILYAVSCGLSDADLADEHDLLVRTGGGAGSDGEEDRRRGRGGSRPRSKRGRAARSSLKTWQQRKRQGNGLRRVRPARAAHRPGPSPHAPVEGRRSGQGGRVPRARALRRQRLFHQRAPGPDRAG